LKGAAAPAPNHDRPATRQRSPIAGSAPKIGVDTFRRIAEEKPVAALAKWQSLLGEYR
jgi:hypothetical protein